VWDEELEKKLQKIGIKSTSIKIKPGQGIILPHGKYHCFKKIHHEPTQGEDAMPLVSCACDASFIGIDNVWNNYQIIKVCLHGNLCSRVVSITLLYYDRDAIKSLILSIHSTNLDSCACSKFAKQ